MTKENSEYYFATAEEAEAAFYSALEIGDKELMEALLADENVSCIHPASVALVGKDEVLSSWKQILDSVQETGISFEVINRSNAKDVAIHLVIEKFSDSDDLDSDYSQALATNVYIHQSNGWRMMMHHASYNVNAEFSDEELLEEAENLMAYEMSQTVH